MSWKNIKLVFLREVRDQLRDRRTLFMIAVLPVLLYPAMGIGMVQMMSMFREQPRTVVILGEENLPDAPQLLDETGIHNDWLNGGASEAEKLRIVGGWQSLGQGDEEDAESVARENLLDQARDIFELVERLATLDEQRAEGQQVQHVVDNTRNELAEQFASGEMQVLLVIPDDFGANLERMNELIASRDPALADFEYDRPIVVQNSADEKSIIAYERIRGALRNWEAAVLQQRLETAELPPTLHTPVDIVRVDLAQDEQIAANIWSKIFPAMLVIMAVTGAFYPAIDLGAGEKERGTMETLLICPATRAEIVLGKFLTVMLFSASTALLNLSSMGMTGQYMVSIFDAGGAALGGSLAVPPFASLCWLLLLLLPLAALFSALCLALATFARSTKEGQYYLTPLLMVTLGLTVFCLSPGVEINAFYSLMPVVNVALLLKGLLLSPHATTPLYAYALPVIITSIGYSLLALWWAVEMFASEDVLFREAERFDLRLWVQHLLRDKEPLPTFGEGVFCFVLIMFLQFGAIKYMHPDLSGPNPGLEMVKLLVIQQLVIVGCPALLMAILLTSKTRQTLRLSLPRPSILAAALVLPLALHPLSVELGAFLQQHFFPRLPESIAEVLATMSSDNLPLWITLGAFALAPAVCEELAFRGFILSGFLQGKKSYVAIFLSSVAFGVMHLIPQQVFNASLLGLVLGLIAVRGGSLLPCIAFHFVYNSLAVLHARFGETVTTTGFMGQLFRLDENQLRYQPLLLLIGAIVGSALIGWLINERPSSTDSPADHSEPGSDTVALVN